jgi:protein-disulfide isomerase
MQSTAKKNTNQILIGGIIGAAIILALAFIILSRSNATQSSGIDYSSLPQSRLEDGGFVLGNPEAPITIIEFADFACPHCQDYKPTMDQFVKDFVATGKARYEFRTFPTAGGEATRFFGDVLACMEDQKEGVFWTGHELLFQKAMAGGYGQDTIRQVAQELGVDYTQALNCTREKSQVSSDVQLGQQLSVQGTPAVRMRGADGVATFVNFGGQNFERSTIPYEVLAAVVEAANPS